MMSPADLLDPEKVKKVEARFRPLTLTKLDEARKALEKKGEIFKNPFICTRFS